MLLRHLHGGLLAEDVEAFVDYLCLVAKKQDIFFLWRPFLRDPDDDMLVESGDLGRDGDIVSEVEVLDGHLARRSSNSRSSSMI